MQLRWRGPGWRWGGLHATLGSRSSPSSLIHFHLSLFFVNFSSLLCFDTFNALFQLAPVEQISAPQMTASLHWEFRVLHNFNPSAHKNRLSPALMVSGLTCKTEDWTKQSRPRSLTFPPISAAPTFVFGAARFAQILKMDFFAHSLLISSPADTWISWQLLIWEQFSQICKTRALLCPISTAICLLSHEGRRKNGACRFSKNGIQFSSLKQVGICWRNIWVFPCWGKLTG